MKPITFILLLAVVLSACAPAPTPTPTPIPPTATLPPPTPTIPPPTPTASQPVALPMELVSKITGGPKPFGGPMTVAVDPQNNLYVQDARTNAILKFDGGGEFITQWGSSGEGDGQFDFQDQAGAVAVDGASNVYVADCFNNRVEKFDSSGKFLLTWGSKGAGEGQFDCPAGVTADTTGNVYISDLGNNRIEKFDGTGKFLAQWGSAGAGEGQFNQPAGLNVDGLGNVYVVDYGNRRIQKFDGAGRFLLQWELLCGTGAQQAMSAWTLTVDRQNVVYVIDDGSIERICEFDSNGKFLGTWGSGGPGDIEFMTPTGIAVDDQGNIYVADHATNLVQKFRQP